MPAPKGTGPPARKPNGPVKPWAAKPNPGLPASSSTSSVSSGSSMQPAERKQFLQAALAGKPPPPQKGSAVRSALPPSASLKLPPAGKRPKPGSILVTENPVAPTKTKASHRPSQPTSSGSKPAASTTRQTKPHTSQEQVLEMQKELAELKAYKAKVEAEKEAASIVPIDRPAGDCFRLDGKEKKNKKGIYKARRTFVLHVAMQRSEERVARMGARAKDLLIQAGIPRGAYVNKPEWVDEMNEFEKLMGKEFVEFTNGTYTGNWPLKEIAVAKTDSQRKYDKSKGSGKKKSKKSIPANEGEPATTNIETPRTESDEQPAGSQDAKVPGEFEPEADDEVDPEAEMEVEPSAERDDAEMGVVTGPELDDDEVGLPYYRDIARLGPVVANYLIDIEMYNLDETWANYKTEEEAEIWKQRDTELDNHFQTAESRIGEPLWYMIVHERLGDDTEEFKWVWKVVQKFEFDEDDDEEEQPSQDGTPPPSASPSPKSRTRKRFRQESHSNDYDSGSAYEEELNPLPSKRRKDDVNPRRTRHSTRATGATD